jgi:hypothetical protein
VLYSQGCRCVECCAAELARVDLMVDEEAAGAAKTIVADAGTEAKAARNRRAARTVRYIVVRAELADAKSRTRTAQGKDHDRAEHAKYESVDHNRPLVLGVKVVDGAAKKERRRVSAREKDQRKKAAREKAERRKVAARENRAIALFRCPTCGAGVSEPCNDRRSGRPLEAPHARRLAKARTDRGKGSVRTVSGGGSETNRRRH